MAITICDFRASIEATQGAIPVRRGFLEIARNRSRESWRRLLPVRPLLRAGIALAAAIAFGAGAAVAEPETRVETGKALFQQYCGACHGISADGKGALSSNLDPRPADLTRIAARRGGVFPDAAIIRMIDGRDPVVGHGKREMPVWGRSFGEGLNPGPGKEYMIQGDISMIVIYLKSIQVPE